MVHGCNTPCVELVDDRHGVLILDAGSGIAGFQPPAGASQIAILLTHYHWDHVLGLPFFRPFYEAGRQLSLYAPELPSGGDRWLDSVFAPAFFPLPYAKLPNPARIDRVRAGSLQLSGFAVRALALNHPGGALAYRIRGASGDLVYATDHEFGDARFDEALATFARGARELILDAQFTPDESPRHRGWGHSDWRQSADFAARADVGRLWLFHHKPGRTDDELVRIVAEARTIFAATDAARESLAFEF